MKRRKGVRVPVVSYMEIATDIPSCVIEPGNACRLNGRRKASGARSSDAAAGGVASWGSAKRDAAPC
jgi:hypothetical protein